MRGAAWLLRQLWHWLSFRFLCQAEHKFNPIVFVGKEGLMVSYRCRFCGLNGVVGPLELSEVPLIIKAVVG